MGLIVFVREMMMNGRINLMAMVASDGSFSKYKRSLDHEEGTNEVEKLKRRSRELVEKNEN
jgi:hypothetical protein